MSITGLLSAVLIGVAAGLVIRIVWGIRRSAPVAVTVLAGIVFAVAGLLASSALGIAPASTSSAGCRPPCRPARCSWW